MIPIPGAAPQADLVQAFGLMNDGTPLAQTFAALQAACILG
jgi:hypothetical protein